MKKLVSVLAAMIVAVSAMSASVYALELDTPINEEIVEEYAVFDSISSTLTVSGNTAICTSIADASNVYSITATQRFQKYSGWLWFWEDVSVWTETQYRNYFATTNRKYNLPSGKYRLVTEYTVTTNDGQTETQTANSFEVNVN